MRLYVVCRHGSHRIYFQHQAATRQQLPNPVRVRCSQDGSVGTYYPWEVFAEAQAGGTLGGAGLGGLIGILGGPIGVVIGAIVGGALGGGAEQQEFENTRRFNAS